MCVHFCPYIFVSRLFHHLTLIFCCWGEVVSWDGGVILTFPVVSCVSRGLGGTRWRWSCNWYGLGLSLDNFDEIVLVSDG